MLRGKGRWQDTLSELFEPHGVTEDITSDLADDVYQPSQMASSSTRKMELPLSRFAVADALLLGGVILILWLALR